MMKRGTWAVLALTLLLALTGCNGDSKHASEKMPETEKERMEEAARDPDLGDSARQKMDRVEDSARRENERMDDAVRRGDEKTRGAVERGVDKTEDAVRHGLDAAGDAVRRGADRVEDAVDGKH